MRKEGYIILDDYIDSRKITDYKFFPFEMNGKKYYFKFNMSRLDVYNELIAEELAKDYGISCAHYDLGSFHGFQGVITEDFVKDKDTYFNGYNIMEKVFKDRKDKLFYSIRNNNLAFYRTVLDDDNFKALINIFIFDALTGNCDRHESNIGFIKNDRGTFISPIFDNEKIVSNLSIENGFYRLSVDEDDDLDIFFNDPLRYKNLFRKFILRYKESKLVEEKLRIISQGNLDSVLDRVEERIDSFIPDIKKEKTKKMLLKNEDKIRSSI